MSGLLRICTAGSVDDGKSTLIGRLYDSRSVYEDQIHSVEKASKNRTAGPIDFSLFTDGLRAEREQGITIDVAYRYFATARRKFILADTPGHEQYTRNMATGASNADVAILLMTRATACARSRGGTRRSRGCSASATTCSPSTRWTWSISTRTSSRTSRRVRELLPAPTCTRSRSARCRATTSSREARALRGSTGRAARVPRNRQVDRKRRRRRSGSRCSWCSGPARSSAAMPARCLGFGPPRRHRHRVAVRPCTRVDRIVTWDGDLEWRTPACR